MSWRVIEEQHDLLAFGRRNRHRKRSNYYYANGAGKQATWQGREKTASLTNRQTEHHDKLIRRLAGLKATGTSGAIWNVFRLAMKARTAGWLQTLADRCRRNIKRSLNRSLLAVA